MDYITCEYGVYWVIPPPSNCPQRGLIRRVLILLEPIVVTVTARGNDPRCLGSRDVLWSRRGSDWIFAMGGGTCIVRTEFLTLSPKLIVPLK